MSEKTSYYFRNDPNSDAFKIRTSIEKLTVMHVPFAEITRAIGKKNMSESAVMLTRWVERLNEKVAAFKAKCQNLPMS